MGVEKERDRRNCMEGKGVGETWRLLLPGLALKGGGENGADR